MTRLHHKSQIRGEALEKRIEAVIRQLAHESQQAGKKYVYNATRTAEAVPTTRRTLAKYEALVARVIDDLYARRRMVTGGAALEHMRDQISYLKEQIAVRDQTINALRAHHVDLYRRFHAYSLDAELLIRPILEWESEEAGRCLFCGTEVDKTYSLDQTSNVISLESKLSKTD